MNTFRSCNYINTCDEKNEDITPFDWDSRSSNDDDDSVMIQLWWWSRSSDDLVVMTQIKWWFGCDDDLVVVMMQILWWRRLEEEDDLEDDLKTKKTKKTWRQIKLEYEDNLKINMMRWSSRYREEDQMLKIVSKE